MLVFSTQLFWNYYPSKHLSGSPPPSPPLPKVRVQYIQTMCGWDGLGVLSCVGDHILQEFNTLFLTKFSAYKFLYHPKQKPRREGDLRQINTCRKVPLQVNFFDNDI
jgi:hypothetical protein